MFSKMVSENTTYKYTVVNLLKTMIRLGIPMESFDDFNDWGVVNDYIRKYSNRKTIEDFLMEDLD